MRVGVTWFSVIVVASPAFAQFDYGVVAGGVLTELHAKASDDPHEETWVGDVGRTAFSFSAFYRERYSDFVDLGLDLTLVHRSFSAGYSYSGLGGGNGIAARVELDQLYIGVKPEVRMDTKRRAVVRFGCTAGFRVGGSAKGSTDTWGIMGPGSTNDVADVTDYFGGDVRFAFGFGFRAPVGDQWAITVDPEATFALSSMLKYPGANVRGTDFGMRIGLSRRCNGKALTSLFKAPPRDAKASPEW